MGRLFGTDGIRGRFGDDLTVDLVRAVAGAAAQVLAPGDSHPVAIVGRDPRPSGPALEAAVAAGLTAGGFEVRLAGVVPTPTVAHLVAAQDAALGVVISASHNPAPDNGIKLFGAGGHKLDDVTEDRIEACVASGSSSSAEPGAAVDIHGDAVRSYVEHLVTSLPRPVDGIRVVVDCANGAAGAVAATAYAAAGADVVVVNDATDGARINDRCGATHPEALQRLVVEHGAAVGIAHDGDADRCIAVDASGAVVDGDAILAVLALALHESNRLTKSTVVTTVMTNLGFKRAMASRGIGVIETPVGDRYVLEAMRLGGYVLGGEQSGHLVMLDHATTGDGLLTALHLLARMAQTGRPLGDLAAVMARLPQVLVNVPVRDRANALAEPQLAAAITALEAELGEDGRVLVRASGTESLVRVMVEAATETTARMGAERIAAMLG